LNNNILEFRVLNLRKTKGSTREASKRPKPPDVPPPRYKQMAVDQDWGAVWPGPRSFHPASVPLPVSFYLNELLTIITELFEL
jgi:small subunit ribosomal protein S35